MNKASNSSSDKFGGQWTVEKLNILEKYLDAYTTALKNQLFKLMYLDAFAGTGEISLRNEDEDARDFIEGSVRLATKIADKPFDRLIFVEKDPQQFAKLQSLHKEYPGRDIWIKESDANFFLKNLQEDWKAWRGVLFLDPFATEVEWATIEKIAGFEALDTWILFPVSSIRRMLPISKKPEDISEKWVDRLNRIFGDQSWNKLYSIIPQQSFWLEDEQYQSKSGVDGIIRIYKDKLKSLFGPRYLETSKTFMNSRKSPLFEFMFCAGNPKGAKLAKKIASHILNSRM